MNIYDEVKLLLVEELQVDRKLVSPEAEFATDLGLNSLELAEFILNCEEKFNITINDDALRGLVRISDVVNYINNAMPQPDGQIAPAKADLLVN